MTQLSKCREQTHTNYAKIGNLHLSGEGGTKPSNAKRLTKPRFRPTTNRPGESLNKWLPRVRVWKGFDQLRRTLRRRDWMNPEKRFCLQCLMRVLKVWEWRAGHRRNVRREEEGRAQRRQILCTFGLFFRIFFCFFERVNFFLRCIYRYSWVGFSVILMLCFFCKMNTIFCLFE